MKAILIPIKPYWFYLIAKGDKTVEVRTSEALANAIQKLIDEYGHAIIYFYISKNGGYLYPTYDSAGEGSATITFIDGYIYNSKKLLHRIDCVNGKVVARFYCDKVEEIKFDDKEVQRQACLTEDELFDYLFINEPYHEDMHKGYAIHISQLEIFDRPRELDEFRRWFKVFDEANENTNVLPDYPITRAPQNMVYIEVEE